MSASYSSSFVSFGPMKLNALALSLKHQIDGIQHVDEECFSALRKVANLAKEYFQQEFDHIHQAYFTACSALCENPALENFHEILQRIKQVETLYILSKEPIFDFSIVKEKLLSLQVKSNSLFAQEPQEHVQMQVDKESRKRSAEEELFAPMTTLFKSKASLS